MKGSPEIYGSIRRVLGLKKSESTTEDGTVTLEKARCFDCCSLAPVIMVISPDWSGRHIYGRLNID